MKTLCAVLLLALVVSADPLSTLLAEQPVAAAMQTVQVVVSVREGDRAVGGLAAGDFVLVDNDVAQEVEAVALDRLPLDLTLIADIGGSRLAGSGLTPDAEQIARTLGRDDALRVVGIDALSIELRAMTPASAPVTVKVTPRPAASPRSTTRSSLRSSARWTRSGGIWWSP